MTFESGLMLAGALLMLFFAAKNTLGHRRLLKEGETVAATVAGTGESARGGRYYLLRFSTQGGEHTLHYPLPNRGRVLEAGAAVTLHYDPHDPSRLFLEGDNGAVFAMAFYYACAAVLLVLAVLLR